MNTIAVSSPLLLTMLVTSAPMAYSLPTRRFSFPLWSRFSLMFDMRILLALLRTVVVEGAQRLEWAGPEQLLVAPMRLHVVTHRSLGDDLVLQAQAAQW